MFGFLRRTVAYCLYLYCLSKENPQLQVGIDKRGERGLMCFKL